MTTTSGAVPIVTQLIAFILYIPYSGLFACLALLAISEYVICLATRIGACTTDSHRSPCELRFVHYEYVCRSHLFHLAQQIAKAMQAFFDNPRRFLLPSLELLETPEHIAYMRFRCLEVEGIKTEIEHTKQLLGKIRGERRERMKDLASNRISDPLGMQSLNDLIEQSRQLHSHVEALEKDLRNIDHIAKTQASADHTGNHGLAEWADKILENHKDPLEALCQVSFLGAGLTYSTIFSATRGNVGLMCYAFAFFNFGFIVPLVALALLKWTSSRHWDMIFATPHAWSVLLNLFIYISAAAVTAAICLLSVTIVLLRFDKDPEGAYSDSPAQFNVEPRVAGASVIACAIISVVMSLIAVALHYMANGWRTLLSDVAGRRKQKPGHRLEEYILQ